jgi:hypothetical protein
MSALTLLRWAWFIGFPLALLRVLPPLWRTQSYKRGVRR